MFYFYCFTKIEVISSELHDDKCCPKLLLSIYLVSSDFKVYIFLIISFFRR